MPSKMKRAAARPRRGHENTAGMWVRAPHADTSPLRWFLSQRRSTTSGATSWESDRGHLALVSRDEGLWHVTVSHPNRYPSWDEMASARERLTPDHVTMEMVLPPSPPSPPSAQYVNLPSTCLHLWEVPTEPDPQCEDAKMPGQAVIDVANRCQVAALTIDRDRFEADAGRPLTDTEWEQITPHLSGFGNWMHNSGAGPSITEWIAQTLDRANIDML